MKTRYKNKIARAIGISTETLTNELNSPPLFAAIQELGYKKTHKRLSGAVLKYVCVHYDISENDFNQHKNPL